MSSVSKSRPSTKRKSRGKRVSKADWLEKALEVLRSEGIGGVRVERLARDIGVAKSGFYWHFRGLADLKKQLLEYWLEEYTGVVMRNPDILQAEPEERLYKIMVMILEYDLPRYDLAMRAWAAHDPLAADAVRKVYKIRLAFLRETFAALGFKGRELKMRARLFVCYQSWEGTVFGDLSKTERLKMLKLEHRLLIRK